MRSTTFINAQNPSILKQRNFKNLFLKIFAAPPAFIAFLFYIILTPAKFYFKKGGFCLSKIPNIFNNLLDSIYYSLMVTPNMLIYLTFSSYTTAISRNWRKLTTLSRSVIIGPV